MLALTGDTVSVTIHESLFRGSFITRLRVPLGRPLEPDTDNAVEGRNHDDYKQFRTTQRE